MQTFVHGESYSVAHTSRFPLFPIALGSPFSHALCLPQSHRLRLSLWKDQGLLTLPQRFTKVYHSFFGLSIAFLKFLKNFFNYRCRIAIERGRMLTRAPGRVLHTDCLFSGNNIRIERLTAVYERDLADLVAGSGGDLLDHLLGSLLFYSLAVIHGHEVARVDLRDKLGHGD